MWKRCTGALVASGLVCSTLLALHLISPDDLFVIVWVVAAALVLVYTAFLSLGDVARKLYLILEDDQERMHFFLQVRQHPSTTHGLTD